MESNPVVKEVEFNERGGVTEQTIQHWEENNKPLALPEDYKSFLQISDGLLLKWKVSKGINIYPFGEMHLNRLREVQVMSQKVFKVCSLGEGYVSFDSDSDEDSKSEENMHSLAVVID